MNYFDEELTVKNRDLLIPGTRVRSLIPAYDEELAYDYTIQPGDEGVIDAYWEVENNGELPLDEYAVPFPYYVKFDGGRALMAHDGDFEVI